MAEFSNLKIEFEELINKCRCIKFEKEGKLEDYRQKLDKEATAFRKLREEVHEQWEKKMRDFSLSKYTSSDILEEEITDGYSEESLSNSQSINEIELEKDTADELSQIYSQIRESRKQSYQKQSIMRKKTLSSIERIYNAYPSKYGKNTIDPAVFIENAQ